MDPNASDDHLARITPIDSPGAGSVLSLRWKVLLNLALITIPAVTVLVELLMVWIGFRIRTPLALVVVATGLLGVTLVNVGWVGSFPEWPMNRLLARRLRRACRARAATEPDATEPDATEPDATEPDAASRFDRKWIESARMVEWVPRENWGATKLDTALDVMLIRVGDRGVEMEGDSGHYFFPPESILGAELESVRPAGCFHRLHFVIVVVRTASGPTEFPLAYRDHTLGRLRSIHRESAAMQLRDSIAGIAVGSSYSELGVNGGTLFVDPSHEEIPRPTLMDRNPYATPRVV